MIAVPGEGLTERERELIGFAQEGLSDREAASRLGLSVNTVKAHWRAIRLKFGTSSRAEVVAKSLKVQQDDYDTDPMSGAETEELLRLSVNALATEIGVAAFILKTDGRIVAASYKAYGWLQADLWTKRFTETMWADDPREFDRFCEGAIRAGARRSRTGRVRTSIGDVSPVQCVARPVRGVHGVVGLLVLLIPADTDEG